MSERTLDERESEAEALMEGTRAGWLYLRNVSVTMIPSGKEWQEGWMRQKASKAEKDRMK